MYGTDAGKEEVRKAWASGTSLLTQAPLLIWQMCALDPQAVQLYVTSCEKASAGAGLGRGLPVGSSRAGEHAGLSFRPIGRVHSSAPSSLIGGVN